MFYALVKMLFNLETSKWHPIYYLDSPFPGGFDGPDNVNNKMLRYKSKGHHTEGFNSRDEALVSANEVAAKLKEMGKTVTVELDEKDDISWIDSNEMPIDIELRPFPTAKV